jgi:hypothetical protein
MMQSFNPCWLKNNSMMTAEEYLKESQTSGDNCKSYEILLINLNDPKTSP